MRRTKNPGLFVGSTPTGGTISACSRTAYTAGLSPVSLPVRIRAGAPTYSHSTTGQCSGLLNRGSEFESSCGCQMSEWCNWQTRLIQDQHLQGSNPCSDTKTAERNGFRASLISLISRVRLPAPQPNMPVYSVKEAGRTVNPSSQDTSGSVTLDRHQHRSIFQRQETRLISG